MTARRLRSARDLVAVIVLAGAAVGLALGGVDIVPLRAVFAVLLALVLPGYALTALTLGDGAGGAARVALVVGASLAATALLGVVLNLFPDGLTADAWSIALGSLTVVAALAAFLRRSVEREPWEEATWRGMWPGARSAALFVLAGVAVAAAIVVAHTGALHQQREQTFTQFWILPGTSGHTVQLGVTNGTPTSRTFRLEFEASARSGSTPSLRPHVLRVWPRVRLQAGEQWHAALRVPDTLGTQRLQARLYRVGSASVYRRVNLTFTG